MRTESTYSVAKFPFALALWLSCVLLYPALTLAEGTVFTNVDSAIKLVGGVAYFEDVDSSQSIDSIASLGDQFQLVERDTANFGFTKSTYWFRFSLTNESAERLLLLEVGYPVLDYLTLYQPNPDGGYQSNETGDMRPFSQRARPHRTFTFELPLESGQSNTYYLAVRTGGSLQLPLRLYSEKSFAAASASENSMLGMYYGVLLVMLVFNGLLWLILRDVNYLYYIGFLFSECMTMMLLNGNAHRYVFFELPWMGNRVLPVFLMATWASSIGFSGRCLELGTYFKRLDGTFVKAEKIFWACCVAAMFLPTSLMLKLGALGAVVTGILLLVASVGVSLKGYRPGQIFLAAWVGILCGVVVYGLKTVGLLPTNIWTEYAVQVGSAIEATLLSFALAYRIQILQAEREMARASEAAAHHSLSESYESLRIEYAKRKEAEEALVVEFKARSHLVAEAAHRLNNPLNVSLGGITALQERIVHHSNLIVRIFGQLADGDEDERRVLDKLLLDLTEMKDTSSDSNYAMKRAAEYLRELRVIGGTEGQQNELVTIEQIFNKSSERIDANLGPGTWNEIKVEPGLKGPTVWSNVYVASSLLDYAVRELDSCSSDGITITLCDDEARSSRLAFSVSTGKGGERVARGDLAGLNLIQLANSIGGGSPSVSEFDSEQSQGYVFVFEMVPPASLVTAKKVITVAPDLSEGAG